MPLTARHYSESPQWHLWLWLILIAGYGLGALAQQIPWLAALAGMVIAIRSPRRAWATPGFKTYLAMLSLVLLPATLSLTDTVSWDSSGSTWIRLLSYAFAGLALMQLNLDDCQWQRFQWGAFLLVLLFAIDGVLQFFLGTNMVGRPLFIAPQDIPRVTGFLRVDYGHVMAVLTPFVLEVLLRHSRRWPWIWLGFSVFVMAIILSGSRASLALFGVAMVLHGFFLVPHVGLKRLMGFFSTVVVLAGIAFALVMSAANTGPRWIQALGMFSADDNVRELATSFRTIIWGEAWRQFLEHPFNGVGLRAFRVASMDALAAFEQLPVKPAGWHAHLMLLEFAACLGSIGVLCYLALYGWWCRWLWRAPRQVLVPGLVVLLAWFPLMSYLSAFSMRICAMLWPMLALALMLEHREQIPKSSEHSTEGPKGMSDD